MRRWSLIVVLIATLAFGATACGLKETDDAGRLATGGDPTTEPGPATTDPAITDDTTADDPPTDDGSGNDGSGSGSSGDGVSDDDGSDDDGSGSGSGSSGDGSSDDGSSGDDGSGGSASGGDDFCSLAKESPDPTSAAAGEEFFERWLASAPEELRDEIEVITDWYEQSQADPDAEMPEEVLDALIALGQYTVENCT
jgi:hypothetical protein